MTMDPIASAATAKLLSVAIGSAISQVGKRVKALRQPNIDPAEVLEAIDVDLLSLSLQELGVSESEGRLNTFLQSPDFSTFLFQLVLLRTAGGPATDLDAARRELAALLSRNASQTGTRSNALFSAIEAAVDAALTVRGGTLAVDAQADAVDIVVRAHLGSIARNIELIERKLSKHVPMAELEQTYRGQAEHRHRLITPPNFGGAKRIPINDIFVSPTIRTKGIAEDHEPRTLDYTDFLDRVHRTVLLGDPGGGKSTLSQKIVHDLAGDDLFSGSVARRTPFLVVLRDYGIARVERALSLVQYIRDDLNARYQVDAPQEFFEFLLLNGRAFVVFDGLDELLDTRQRRTISEDVESFCNLYPSTPVLVTSRMIGYDVAPLDSRAFDVYMLSALSDEQVEDYALKWFSLDEEFSNNQSTSMANAFLNESSIVADLRSNPLMLSLMCNIYKGENYIPANRPDVYEKCALMLFDRWDTARDILYVLPFQSHVRPAMMHLAFKIHEDPSLQSGIPRGVLERLTATYLLDRRFDDADEAKAAAETFIDFCTGRAWVFTDVGTTAEGEALYQFTHRTFLEYFTAAHLIRQRSTPDELLEVLAPRIMAAEWDVVAQLAVQMQNRNVEGAAEVALLGLLARVPGSSEAARSNILSFCARCLGFIVPSAYVTKTIAAQIVLTKIAEVDSIGLDIDRDELASALPRYVAGDAEPLSSLLASSAENWPAVRTSIIDTLSREIKSGSDCATAICLNLEVAFEFARSRLASDRRLEWEGRVRALRVAHADEICELAKRSPSQGVAAIRAGIIGLYEMVQTHGVSCLLQSYYTLFRNVSYISLAEEVVRTVASHSVLERTEWADTVAAEFASVSSAISEPWPAEVSGVPSFPGILTHSTDADRSAGNERSIDQNAFDGASLLLAILLSVEEYQRQTWPADVVGTLHLGRLSFLRPLLTLRIDGGDDPTLVANLLSAGISHNVVLILMRWALREVELINLDLPSHSLVKPSSSESTDGV